MKYGITQNTRNQEAQGFKETRSKRELGDEARGNTDATSMHKETNTSIYLFKRDRLHAGVLDNIGGRNICENLLH